MAESSFSLARDQFSCSICLGLLKDPVAIPCGHSYCMSCISGFWDKDEQKGVYSCPHCRRTFNPRPALGKNFILTEVVENLKKRKLQAARPAHSESGNVECDVCTGRKYKAVKSCLVCLESYCQIHFERHEEFHSRKRHKVTDATAQLKEMICPQHDRELEMYCRTDQRCICMMCFIIEHKTHETVLAAAERAEKQKHLEEKQRKVQERIQERQKELEELREAVESHKRSAQAAVEDTERIFTELICSIKNSRSEVMQLIRDQEKAAVSQTKGRLERLKQEIDDLRGKDSELEQLSRTDQHIHFLQSFQSLSAPPGSTDSPSICTPLSFDNFRMFVTRVKERLKQTVKEVQENIVRNIKAIPTSEYEKRNEFLQYYQRFTLDSNTGYRSLKLSDGNRVVTRMKKTPDHPDRFDGFAQVLCRERVCGRCYWEVERSGRGMCISVSYKSISRKGRGNECRFGCNDQSWSLYFSDTKFLFRHNNKQTKLPVVSSSSRIGVYVDHSAGTLSFYSVSDTVSLIHRVRTTFTQPLYPGFGVYHESIVKLCDQAKPTDLLQTQRFSI